MLNKTRKRSRCDECGRPIYTSAAKPRTLCQSCSLPTYDVYWSPEGRVIATVKASNGREAIRKAPMPYRRKLGELYAKIKE